MSGYTPLFSSLTTGSLCGRWPDIGLWPIVLSLADKNGVVDVTCQYISSVTGLAIDQVVECMQRFCQPDPSSRTTDRSGARLELVDPSRSWGWVVLNHKKYREKARLMAKAAQEVTTGQNKQRMGDRRRPPPTAAHRPSDSDANTDKNKRAAPVLDLQFHDNLPTVSWHEWIEYRKSNRFPCTALALKKQLALLAQYDSDTQTMIIDTAINAGWQGLFPPKGNGAAKPKERGFVV